MITVAIVNFWEGAENGFWFISFIKENIGDCALVSPTSNPDILFASCFGPIHNVKRLTAKFKIFAYGENLDRFPPYNDINVLKSVFDLIVGFKYTDLNNKILRFPLWLWYYNNYNGNSLLDYIEDSYKKNINESKTIFGTLVARYDLNGNRQKLFNMMEKYGNVLCPSEFNKNCESIGGESADKINFIKKGIYNICPENSKAEGYFTEKIIQALEGGTIPIYWAIDYPECNLINKNKYCFVNIEDNELAAKQIEDVVINKEKYIEGNVFTKEASYIIENYYSSLAQQIKYGLNIIPKQKIYGISYGSRHFERRINEITLQANNSGLFDEFKCFTEDDIDATFINLHKDVWYNSARGGGWWIWKPYITLKTLEKINENDILVYIDSGCSLNINETSKNRFNEYIELVNNNWCGFLRFDLPYKECDYTNKKMIEYFKTKYNLPEKHAETPQIIDGIYFLRKNKFTMDFFKSIMDIIDDDHYLFTEKYSLPGELHRHDQSAYSLLYKAMNGDLIINDETWFQSGFGSEESLKYPIWATRKINK